MCTVTFLPLQNGNFIFTSNRDEQVGRETLYPDFYDEDGVEMLYPKDKKAGGTWIALSNKNRLVCLLNGGFETHTPTGNYKFSRGLVVKEVLKATEVISCIENFDLENVEPFTLVVVDWNVSLQLIELVWDGEIKHIQKLANAPRIWSSSTLYTQEMKKERELWFSELILDLPKYSQEDILNFHEDSSKGTIETAVKMKRSYVETVSVTSVVKNTDELSMLYKDIINNHSQKKHFNFVQKEMEVNE